jgi:hypothetical protein
MCECKAWKYVDGELESGGEAPGVLGAPCLFKHWGDDRDS